MLLAIVLMIGFIAFGQSTDKPPAPTQGEDVLRINTDLVQTDVMVFDKQGRFVDNLRPQDFELRIDGQPRQISSFDRVTAGSRTEDLQLAAARGQSRALAPQSESEPLVRGRTIFFFIDDLHLGPSNLTSTRNLLSSYIDKQMRQNDEVAITSASGQLGFLQQITDNKDVLHTAITRLKFRPSLVRDFDRPPMSEYQALAIERNNLDVINYFVEELMKDLPSPPPIAAARVGALPTTRAEQQVRDRATLILRQAAVMTTNTLSSLESLVRSAAKFPGRKLVFFMSNGFFLDLRNSDSLDRLRVITSAAARSGVVIYSVDVRGLIPSNPDASSEAGPDPGGRLQRIAAGELIESQDGMNALARDTGGRAILNTNSLESAINKALAETSEYYLLAWRPDNEEQKSDRFRMISVSVVGHSEFTVRMRQGFSYTEPPDAKSSKPDHPPSVNAKENDNPLRSAILAPAPENRLPISLSLTYVNAPDKGLVLTIGIQTRPAPGAEKHQIEVAGLVFNEEGKVGVQFADQLNGDRLNAYRAPRDLVYVYPVTIPCGLYQIRVGVRDLTSGTIGTAQDWIRIPDLSTTPLAVSSLIISERLPDAMANGSSGEAPISADHFSTDHLFHRDSYLRFLLFLYSQASTTTPDLAVQLQVTRDDKPVLTTSPRKVNTVGVQDLTKLAYAAEISLEHLTAGRYLLQVTAIDRANRREAIQRTRFQIQ